MVAAIGFALPGRDGRAVRLDRALAAIGPRPVLHARIDAATPGTTLVDLATGRATPRVISIEYWFDEPRNRLKTVVRHSGVVIDEFLEVGGRRVGGRGDGRLSGTAEVALNPALAAFVTGYRAALARGDASRSGEGKLGDRTVMWLLLDTGRVRERVAVDAATYAPLLITPLDENGQPGAISWRVRSIATVARVEAHFEQPRPRPPRPYRGDVRGSRAVSSRQLASLVGWRALWLGQSWRGLRLESLELQTLSRGYPPGTARRASAGRGARIRYSAGGRDYVELSQARAPEPAYAYSGGNATFEGNPIPPEGFIELVELPDSSRGMTTVLGQLRVHGVYVTIWAPERELALAAARALRAIRAPGGSG